MSVPIRNLPVLQNFSCHSCSDCCRIDAEVTDEEKRRIEALTLTDDPEVGAMPWFSPVGWDGKKWTLKHRPDGSCVFLTANNRCRIQERLRCRGEAVGVPIVSVCAGSRGGSLAGWRAIYVPIGGGEQGSPDSGRREGTGTASARQVEKHTGRSMASAPPPLMRAGQQLSWDDVCRVVQVLLEMMQDRSDRLERRMRKCLAVARVCGQSQMDGIKGSKLTEFMQTVRQAVEPDVPRSAADVPLPDGLLGRVLFRTLLAIYTRRDRDIQGARGVWSRLGRVRAGWRFVRGRGPVPRINEFLPEVSFEDVEQSGPMPMEWDAMLERYYVVKLSSLQFCGPPNFDLPFWAGLESLALTLPMILWLNRAFMRSAPEQALQRAVQLVDEHFGADPMLNLTHFRFMQRTIAERGELEKLVAWYGR